MFEYANASEVVTNIVSIVLSPDGAFLKDGLLKTELGSNCFLSLTDANTVAALEAFEATIGAETRERLLELITERRRIVWALEKIAVERSLFTRAARLLLRLAEAENEHRYGNNASGSFAGLFSLGLGRTAPTQAPPSERFPALASALSSESQHQRTVAVNAWIWH
jgi:hypothetical protein